MPPSKLLSTASYQKQAYLEDDLAKLTPTPNNQKAHLKAHAKLNTLKKVYLEDGIS